MTRHPLAARAADLLGERFETCEALRGGDLSEVVRLRTATGRTVVAKSGPFASNEAAMLRAIRASGARAPEPFAVAEDVLVLEDLGPEIRASDTAWRDLAVGLRRLHDATGPDYGWDADHAFGTVAICNARRDDWPTFWLSNRLLAAPRALPRDVAARIERLATPIAAALPARPRPSLLHGDLWTGNVHFGRHGPALIDPACYYGDAEVDLAMLTLFGSPPPAFLETYGPLFDGWELRRAIYQLWPALVHLRLFGSGYRPMVERCMDCIAQGAG